MEIYYEQGFDKKECELKIMEKYKRPFHIQTVKEIRLGGFMGLFTKPGVEVGFYFSPTQYKNPSIPGYQPASSFSWYASEPTAGRSPLYTVEQHNKNKTTSLEEEKRNVIAAAGKNYEQIISGGKETSQIINYLEEIKEKIENTSGAKEEHPALTRCAELLKLNDFSNSYIEKMLAKARKELSLDNLEDPDLVHERLIEWIGESINIYKEEQTRHKPRIMVLVGPTGVGKTTTISKLAAIYGIGTDEIPAVNVRMITIDAFRICAKEQLESIGNIMQIPVSCVDNKIDLRKEIALYSEETDLFLIDTIGKSPKDSSQLGEMKEILEGCGRYAEFHLVMSAGVKTADMENIMQQFEIFNYKSVIISKLDETDYSGNVISALAEKGKSVSYITDGQKLPEDIRKASVIRLLNKLEGFKIDRNKIEKRFPSGEAEQFKWK